MFISLPNSLSEQNSTFVIKSSMGVMELYEKNNRGKKKKKTRLNKLLDEIPLSVSISI